MTHRCEHNIEGQEDEERTYSPGAMFLGIVTTEVKLFLATSSAAHTPLLNAC